MRVPDPDARLRGGELLRAENGCEVVIQAWRGEGSYARVYRAALSGARSRTSACAVKLAKPEIPGAAARLEREGAILARVRHPRVVALFAAGRREGTPFLVLEWLEGETLFDLLAARPRLALRQALEILEPVCEGLAAVHALGLAHGDLRPQNVIVTPARGAVLTDPGSVGSGDEAAGVRAGDIRAAGDLLYRMLTGTAFAEPPLLTPAAGYNREAVRLWEATRADVPLSAEALLEQVRRLRASL